MAEDDLTSRIHELAAEIARLERVNEVLMNRVERSTDAGGTSYSLFETNLLLQSKVARHLAELTEVNRALQDEIRSHRATEEALRWERNFVDTVLQAANALILVIDVTGKVVRFNRACERVSGYTIEEIRQRTLADLMPDEELGQANGEFLALLRRTGAEHTEHHWVSRSGERRLISWSNSTILDDAGEVAYIVSLGVDITEARAAERALELYRRIYQASRDAILITDRFGAVAQANQACLELKGMSQAEIRGASAQVLADYGEHIGKVLETRGSYKGEASVTLAGGERRTVDLSVFPIVDDAGVPIHWVGMARDITDLKQALDALERKNRELQSAQATLVQSEKMAALGRLVAGIAHEINTPVGSIASMHDSLVRAIAKLESGVRSQPFPDESARANIDRMLRVIADANRIIQTGTDRVTGIVRRLRSFARLDEAELKRADIHEGLDDTLTLLQHELKRGVEVVRRYGDVPPVPHFVGRLNQVFLNLLVNARQAIPERGTITVQTELSGGNVRVAVRDTGIGIPAENLDKIFDPGFTTKGVGVGTGLGLSICYQIMSEHRGRITVESEVDRGSTFTVAFPANLDEILGIS
ncbi:MAG: PAS domain S-box protein [Polyangiaceae bacterium]|nr:PAS domain S-box protein [Polyangiaceae bacterium]